jgi:hypothetical protein
MSTENENRTLELDVARDKAQLEVLLAAAVWQDETDREPRQKVMNATRGDYCVACLAAKSPSAGPARR